eukprot:EG_transcript_4661
MEADVDAAFEEPTCDVEGHNWAPMTNLRPVLLCSGPPTSIPAATRTKEAPCPALQASAACKQRCQIPDLSDSMPSPDEQSHQRQVQLSIPVCDLPGDAKGSTAPVVFPDLQQPFESLEASPFVSHRIFAVTRSSWHPRSSSRPQCVLLGPCPAAPLHQRHCPMQPLYLVSQRPPYPTPPSSATATGPPVPCPANLGRPHPGSAQQSSTCSDVLDEAAQCCAPLEDPCPPAIEPPALDYTFDSAPLCPAKEAAPSDAKPSHAEALLGRLLAQHGVTRASQLTAPLFNRLCTLYLSADPSPLPGPPPGVCYLDEFDAQAAPHDGRLSLELALDIVLPIANEWPFKLPTAATRWLMERLLKFRPTPELPLLDRSRFIQLRDLIIIAHQVTAVVLKKLAARPLPNPIAAAALPLLAVSASPPSPHSGCLSLAAGSLEAHSSWDA